MEENENNLGEDGRPMLHFPSMGDQAKVRSSIITGVGDDAGKPTITETRDDAGKNMLDFKGSNEFDISDRSEENQQRAVDDLRREYGGNYESAVKNARAVLKWSDEEYPKSLEKNGLGNYPPLIIALDKLGKELEIKNREARQSGAMKEPMLKAFEREARDRVNKLISKMESSYIAKHGPISKL